MSNELSTEARAALESMIDTAGLSAVLRALAIVCADKSEHVALNWQDKDLARRWAAAHKALMRAGASSAVENVSNCF